MRTVIDHPQLSTTQPPKRDVNGDGWVVDGREKCGVDVDITFHAARSATIHHSLTAICAAFLCILFIATTAFGQTNIAITSRHAPAINGQGRVEGSVQQLLGENVTLNGGATLTHDLLVPGTPTVSPNGSVSWSGVQVGTGSTAPGGYTVLLNGGVSLRNVRTRTDAITLPGVPMPPASAGTRSVTINKSGESAGTWAAVRDLRLNGNARAVAVPPGIYRDFTVNGGCSLVLGIAGAAQPATYAFQNLTLNGQATITIVGPVVLHLGSSFNANGRVGVATHPEWLQIKVANGGVTLNSHATVHGSILAPQGQVIINGQSELCGTTMSDSFRLNGGGLVRWCSTSMGTGNRPPIANAQSLVATEDIALLITLTGSDPDGNPLAFNAPTDPAHGTLTGSGAQLFYTPDANYSGGDSFTFTVGDGSATSAPATVLIDVLPVNDAPVADSRAVLVTEDTPFAVTFTARDADGDSLSFSIGAQPGRGTVEKDTRPGAGAGDFIYWPAPNSTAPDAFTYIATDPLGARSEASVSVTITPVGDIPKVDPAMLSLDEDGELPITLAGEDPDGEALELRLVAGSGPAHGTVTGTSPRFIYKPAGDFHGSDTFQYVAVDEGGDVSASALVTIEVRPVDDVPQTVPLSLGTDEDVDVVFAVSAHDADGEPLRYNVVQQPSHGTLSGAGPTFIYRPDADFFGQDSFSYIAVDSADPDALSSAPATVPIEVRSVNDRPVAEARGLSTSEDIAFLITLAAADRDGDALTYAVPRPADSATSYGPLHGALTATEDPKVWLYTPVTDSTAPDNFTFRATDPDGAFDDALVSIIVIPINDEPTALPIPVEVREDETVRLTLAGVDIDDVDLAFEVIAGSGPASGLLSGQLPELTYQPAADYFGADVFDYVAIDGFGLRSAPARVSITVEPVNDAPVITPRELLTDEDQAVEIQLTATDAESDPVTFLEPTSPSYGTLQRLGEGRYRYQPAPDFHGVDTFIYQTSDHSLDSAPAAVTVSVRPINDRPAATAPHRAPLPKTPH